MPTSEPTTQIRKESAHWLKMITFKLWGRVDAEVKTGMILGKGGHWSWVVPNRCSLQSTHPVSSATSLALIVQNFPSHYKLHKLFKLAFFCLKESQVEFIFKCPGVFKVYKYLSLHNQYEFPKVACKLELCNSNNKINSLKDSMVFLNGKNFYKENNLITQRWFFLNFPNLSELMISVSYNYMF